MNETCPHCRQPLEDYWWETRLPQSRWTKQQAAASAQRQRAVEEWERLVQSVYSSHNTRDAPST
jgi:hypothetical protein